MECRYCGKESDKDFCCFECRKAFLDYFDDEDKYRGRRKTMLIASVIVSIPFILLFFGAGITLMFFLLGTTLVRCPYTKAETKKRLTVKRAKEKMITNGIILIIIGLPFLLLTRTFFF